MLPDLMHTGHNSYLTSDQLVGKAGTSTIKMVRGECVREGTV